MKNLVLGTVFALLTAVGYGQEKNKKMSFEVNGKCAMCKERIEEAALAVKGVKYALWDIPTHQLSLIIDERKTNSMEIKTAIVGVGHDTKELKATDNSDDGQHHE
jgi:cation transport ATPase